MGGSVKSYMVVIHSTVFIMGFSNFSIIYGSPQKTFYCLFHFVFSASPQTTREYHGAGVH